MHTRCSNPNVPGYKDYGGRGIAVCSEWADFQRFQRWALENGYQDDLSIERKDSDLGYSPSNCVWATPTTQSRNRRFVAKAPDGRPWSLVARENGITVSAYRTRLRDGWPHDLAATWPMRKRRPGLEHHRDKHGRFA